MTRDDIIAMAREAGKTKWFGTHPDGTSDFLGAEFSPEQLERFAALVAAVEREKNSRVHSFLRRLLDPEDLGHAVSHEVRQKVRELL